MVKKMRIWLTFKTLLILLLLSVFVFAQDRGIEQEFNRLRNAIEQTAGIIRLLPDVSDHNFKATLEQRMQAVQQKYEEAVQFAQNHQFVKARMAIKQTFGLLEQIEAFIQRHPVLKIKYQEELDRKIQLAEELLQGSRTPERLIRLLNLARFYRQKAFAMFRDGRTVAAMEYYRLAMHLAEEIISILKTDKSHRDNDYWQRVYIDTEILLERAKTLMENNDKNPQMRNMLRKADAELEDVRRLYERKNDVAAQQRLVTINRALYRILDLLEKAPQDETERLKLDIQSLQFSLQNVESELSKRSAPAAHRIYKRANNLADKAESLLDRGRVRLARRNLFFANQLVVQLYRRLENSGSNQPQQIQNQINRTRESLRDLQNQQAEWDTKNQFLQIIENNLKQAENAYRNNDYARATLYLKMTNRLILQFNHFQLKQSISDVNREMIRQDLQRLSTLLDRFAEKESSDSLFKIRYQNTQMLYEMAQKAFDENDLYKCRELTNLATKIITQ